MAALDQMHFANHIPQDSLPRKLGALIPIIGPVISLVQEHALGMQIENSYSPMMHIELIRIKNEYKLLNYIRSATEAIVVVTLIALKILTSSYFISAAIFFSIAMKNAYDYNRNLESIRKLENEEGGIFSYY